MRTPQQFDYYELVTLSYIFAFHRMIPNFVHTMIRPS